MSTYFSTDKVWPQDKEKGWELVGGDLSKYKAHLWRSSIHCLNKEGEVEDYLDNVDSPSVSSVD